MYKNLGLSLCLQHGAPYCLSGCSVGHRDATRSEAVREVMFMVQ